MKFSSKLQNFPSHLPPFLPFAGCGLQKQQLQPQKGEERRGKHLSSSTKMGICLCREQSDGPITIRSNQSSITLPGQQQSTSTTGTCSRQDRHLSRGGTNSSTNGGSQRRRSRTGFFTVSSWFGTNSANTIKLHHQVDRLVLETLSVLRTLVDSEQDPPQAMLRLHVIADKEKGWLTVVHSMINVIPMNDPLGPAVILLLLDDCPLPTKDSILKLIDLLNLRSSSFRGKNCARHRNISIVLGCMAEKLAGPNSMFLLTDGILDYLVANLVNHYDPSVVLFSLIALEKFAQTSENKLTINRKMKTFSDHPLTFLESWSESSNDFIKKQVSFCSRWSLDNLCK